jgi:hypothetical protein
VNAGRGGKERSSIRHLRTNIFYVRISFRRIVCQNIFLPSKVQHASCYTKAYTGVDKWK